MLINISSGYYHVLGLKDTGLVTAWGWDYYGQCTIPVGLIHVTAIAGGGSHSLALKNDGTVIAWGWNFQGQCDVPVGLINVTAIAAGAGHSLALKSDDTIVVWGWNDNGQCTIPGGLTSVISISGGYAHSLALKSDGTVVAWGYNNKGQCDIPVGLTDVTAIAAGGYHSLALKSDGTVVAWGSNDYNQCDIPVGLTNVTVITAGLNHCLALKSDGTVVAWGYNNYGQCDVPVGLIDVITVVCGDSHSTALKDDGTVVSWGCNDYGQSGRPLCNLIYTAGIGGTIDGNIYQIIDQGSNGTQVIATPNFGYIFSSWSDGLFLTPERTDLNVISDLSVNAIFEKKFFVTSSYVTMGIVLFPNTSDDWKTITPLSELLNVGEAGYVFSTSLVNDSDDLHLITGILENVSKISNSIDFITKTLSNSDSNEKTTSEGIGGISKLKDFTFTLISDTITTLNVLKFYGRIIKVVLWEGNKILNIDDGRVVFKGEIYKVDKNHNELKFSARGLLSSLKTQIKGAEIIDLDGEVVNEPIIIGYNPEKSLVPLKKTKNKYGNTVISFAQFNDYYIRDLYVKQISSDDKPVFCKVTSEYNINTTEKSIYFGKKENNFLNLAASIGLTDYYIYCYNYNIIALKINGSVSLSVGDLIVYSRSMGFNNIWYFLRTETIGGNLFHLFAVTWDTMYGKAREWLDQDFIDNDNPLEFWINNDPGNIFTISYYMNYSEAFIDKEIDTTCLNFDKPIDGLTEPSRLTEGWGELKSFNTIPQEGIVITIDSEEMLVVDSQKVFDSAPFYTPINKVPFVSRLTVIRGWNDTSTVSHTNNSLIRIKDFNINSVVDYKYSTVLRSLNTIAPHIDNIAYWKTSNINEFLKGTKDLKIESSGLVLQHYLGLIFDIPELKGDIISVRLLGKASAIFRSYFRPSVTTEEFWIPQYIMIHPALTVTGIDDGTYKPSRLYTGINETDRLAAKNLGVSSMASAIITYDSMKLNHTILMGEYSMLLDGVWRGVYIVRKEIINQSRTVGGINYRTLYTIPGAYDRTYGIKSLDDLRDGLFIVLQGSNWYGYPSIFTLSRPTLEVEMSSKIEDSDLYADIVPKKIINSLTKTAELPTGSNPKFFIEWDNTIVGQKSLVLVVSCDDTFIVLCAYINFADGTLYNYTGLLGSKTGKLMYNKFKNVPSGNKIFVYKIYDNEYKYLEHNTYTGVSNVVSNSYPSGKLEKIEHTFLIYGNFVFIAGTNKITIYKLTDVILNNPVTVIKTLFEDYAPNITLDTTSFAVATANRVNWKCFKVIDKATDFVKLIDSIGKQHGLLITEKLNGDIAIQTLGIPKTSDIEIPDAELLYDDDMINYTEDFTELDYLITKMDVKFNKEEDKFKGLIESSNLTVQNLFNIAKTYINNEVYINLELDSIFDENTAGYSATAKMFYHYTPTRLLSIKSIKPSVEGDMCEWVTFTGSKIPDVSGNLYLITGISISLPFKDQKFHLEFETYEYTGDSDNNAIQEVPDSTLIDYQEVHTATISIQEV